MATPGTRALREAVLGGLPLHRNLRGAEDLVRLGPRGLELGPRRARQRGPATARPRGPRRKPSHESWDSVSTTSKPGTWRMPRSSQAIAVTTATDPTLPPSRHFTKVASSHM